MNYYSYDYRPHKSYPSTLLVPLNSLIHILFLAKQVKLNSSARLEGLWLPS